MQVSIHLRIFKFRPPPKPENPACWGQPQTLRNLGPTWPEVPALRLAGCVSFAIAPVPCFSPARQAEQIINVCFCRRDFPHFPPGLPVLGVELLFLRRQPAAFLFKPIHFGELCTVQNGAHGCPRRPVNLNFRLMLHKVFPAVPGRFVRLEHRAGLGHN